MAKCESLSKQLSTNVKCIYISVKSCIFSLFIISTLFVTCDDISKVAVRQEASVPCSWQYHQYKQSNEQIDIIASTT